MRIPGTPSRGVSRLAERSAGGIGLATKASRGARPLGRTELDQKPKKETQRVFAVRPTQVVGGRPTQEVGGRTHRETDTQRSDYGMRVRTYEVCVMSDDTPPCSKRR